MIRRLVLIGLAATAFLVATAAPASAHTISGPRPTNFRSRIVSIDPPVSGVTVRLVDLGAKVELTNDTATDVVVLGYQNEPYLRVGPNGVFENVHSTATYVNRSVKGGVIPSDVDTDPKLAPEWRKISHARTARWHDHRAHFMGTTPPPLVATDPGTFHRIAVRPVPFTQNGTVTNVNIELDWVPGPSPAPWIPVAIVAFGIAMLVAMRRSWRALVVALAVLVLVDVTHAIAYEMARPGGVTTKVWQFLGGSFVSIVVWIAAVPTMIGLARRRSEALFGALFVGLMVALVGGATDVSSWWKSQLPPAGPDWLTRLAVALALGLGTGAAVGSLVRILRTERASSKPAEGKWLATLVVGLDDKELRRIAAELDVDDVLSVALADVSARLGACRDAFEKGSLVFDVASDDDAGRHTWSLTPAPAHGRVEPVAVQLALPFALLLQLLAGTVALDDAVASGRAKLQGDDELVARVAPLLGEEVTRRDREPAS